ncbi:alcohol dehydrogenase [Mycena sanguinolenta]|nr:alcohol dehydrogenase [Mycena sanguinolenta]
MRPVPNGRVIFARIPKDFPVTGETTVHDTTQTIDLTGVPLNGGFLVKTLVLSVDPYLRGKMRCPEKKSYFPPVTMGEPIDSIGVGVVLRSGHPEVSVSLVKNPKLPWTVFVGAAGMPGQTAFYGWKEFSRAKKDETAFITTGAVTMVIQLVKRDGLKVVASAGSDADVAFNSKTTNTREVLEREEPIEVYWDNVGAQIFEAALENANINGRFIEYGMIPGYNTGHQDIKGSIVGLSHKKEFYAAMLAALASGELKYLEDINRGLETVGEAILGAAVIVAQD